MPTVPNNRPNLFIVGAMKSGTTSLHNYLSIHPEIFMSDMKEPGYFVEQLNWPKGEQWYLSLFEGAQPHHRFRGESSTEYTKLPIYQNVPERIHAFNPDARIIYIMRHPFERIVSHYWFAVRHVHTGGLRKDFYTACTSDPQFIEFSNYSMQIRPYIEQFGAERVLLLAFEDLLEDPRSLIIQILQWLELDETIDWRVLEKSWNARPEQIVGVGHLGALNRIAHSRAWEHISPLMPRKLKAWATNLSHKTIDPGDEQANIDRLKEELRTKLSVQIDEMSELMGRDLNQLWRI